MKVYLEPTCIPCSRAMYRVADALREYAPRGVQFVSLPGESDLQVLHAIGMNARPDAHAREYAVIQYCTTNDSPLDRGELWGNARLVWSYYDLPAPRLYHAPLGGDGRVFYPRGGERRRLVLTSGYVNGPGAEAIEAATDAALQKGLSVIHLGPDTVVGMRNINHPHRRVMHNISDNDLAKLYSKCEWVAAMRYIEGFELPAVEGLLCGARPIMFDQPATRRWYEGHAEFVPEYENRIQLTQRLREVFSSPAVPVSEDEMEAVKITFDWRRIVEGFWKRISE